MALPYWPEPPERLSIASMRLSMTMVPSSPGLPRQTWMPLLPAPVIVLRAISSARASKEWIATSALSVDERVDDLAVDRGAGDGGAAGAEDFAVGDLDAADVLDVQEAAPVGQAALLAVEHQAGERDVLGAGRADQRGAVAEDQLGRAAHADDLRVGGKLEIADAIAAGRDRERRAVACGLVDGALEGAALVVGAAGTAARSANPRRRMCPSARAPPWPVKRRPSRRLPDQKSATIHGHGAASDCAHRDHVP